MGERSTRRDPSHLGSLWAKRGPSGNLYFTGTIEGIGPVVVFANSRKRSEKSPDWRILRAQTRDRQEAEE